MTMTKKRLAILISGRGSNMLALATAVKRGEIDAEICMVMSDRADAAGLIKARELGLPTEIMERQDFSLRSDFDRGLLTALNLVKPDLVVLAGFMHVLGTEVVDAYYGRMINIHPSLLPKYPGLGTHDQVIRNGDKKHGLTVHYVSSEPDAGPIIMQQEIDVLSDDNKQSLAGRLLEYEHKCLIKVTALLCADRISLDLSSRQVFLDSKPLNLALDQSL